MSVPCWCQAPALFVDSPLRTVEVEVGAARGRLLLCATLAAVLVCVTCSGECRRCVGMPSCACACAVGGGAGACWLWNIERSGRRCRPCEGRLARPNYSTGREGLAKCLARRTCGRCFHLRPLISIDFKRSDVFGPTACVLYTSPRSRPAALSHRLCRFTSTRASQRRAQGPHKDR